MVKDKSYLNNLDKDEDIHFNENIEIKNPAIGIITYKNQEYYYFGQIKTFSETRIGKKGKTKKVQVKRLCLFTINNHTDLSLEPQSFIIKADKLENYKFKDYTGFNLFNNQWDITEFKNNSFNLFINEELFKLIKSKFEDYIDFPNKSDYTFMTLWIMGTYFFPLFQAYPYIHLHGFKNSGKTKVIQISSKMAFNALNSSNISPSALFRIVEGCKPTLFLDEFEPIKERRKARSDDEMELILNSGYKRGGMALRNVKVKDDWQPQAFNTYSPKLISNIGGLKGALASRCIKITMLRAKSDDKRANKFIKDEDPDWEKIRTNLYHLAMISFSQIRQQYEDESIVYPKEISNRELELWKPILVMAGLISNDVYNEMIDYAIMKINKNNYEESAFESWESKLLNTLLEYKDKEGKDFQIKEITHKLWEREFVDEENSDDYGKKYLSKKPNYAWVGRTLRTIPNLKFKKSNGRSYIYLNKTIIDNITSRLMSTTELETDQTVDKKEDEQNVKEQFMEK
ncbi:MAG: hypothetical protein R6V14_05380 [Halanaerobiales bacterium]